MRILSSAQGGFDFGFDRPLIRTIRGVGYQIGEGAKPS